MEFPEVLSEVKKLEFPGPGTAMAFAAAVAAGAAGYSRDNNLCCILILLSIVLASFTVAIELVSGPYYTKKPKTAIDELELISKSREMLEREVIGKVEHKEIKQAIISRIKSGSVYAFRTLFIITTLVIILVLVVFVLINR